MSEYVRVRSHAAEVAKAHASRIAAGNAARLAAARLLPCVARSAGGTLPGVAPDTKGAELSADPTDVAPAAQEPHLHPGHARTTSGVNARGEQRRESEGLKRR
jgi:hypothetical protein